MSFERVIGFKYLAGKRIYGFISIITWISILGVAVGVMALITVLAVMTGAQDELKEKILGTNAHIIINNHFGDPILEYKKMEGKLATVDGVTFATAYIISQAVISSNSRSQGVLLRGKSFDDTTSYEGIGKYIIEGSIDDLDLKNSRSSIELNEFSEEVDVVRVGIALGEQLANKLLVTVGDNISLIMPNSGSVSIINSKPLTGKFYVGAIFKSGLFEYDSSLAFISLESAQSILNIGDRVSGIEVRVDDIYNTDKISESIKSVIGYPFSVRDWKDLNKSLFLALQLEKVALGIILTLIIGVAAFNIASSLIMVVMSKRQDIAILKAMGATKRSIMKIFMIKGIVIGLLGVFLGTVGALILCTILKEYNIVNIPTDIYNLDKLPVKLELVDITVVILAALILTIIATIYPAYSASKQDPCEALRHE
ncbi:MAG: FtsX-like permease family protein [Nitrospinota bacterium]